MNTLPDSVAIAGETEEDLKFLAEKWAEFLVAGDAIYVAHSYEYERDNKPWRCGHPRYRPTFGATRREAVELMIVQCVVKRLSEKKRMTVAQTLKENFTG